MPKLPSERFYFNRREHGLVFAGLDQLVFRIKGSKLGSGPYERRSILYEGGADAYKDRQFDEAIYQAFVSLRSKFEHKLRGRYPKRKMFVGVGST